jgi:Fe-S-cluster-containing dehydrogenase component
MACKVAYDLPVEEHRVYVETIGGGGVDLPGGSWPNLHMKWRPVFTNACINCHGAQSTDGVPFCAYNCTTEALTTGDLSDENSAISKDMSRLRGMGYAVRELPAWQGSRSGVYYAEKEQ